ncbi:MAG TPA: phosphomannomutase/phosphoglucomutase [Hyphomicrobiales bacterium]|nr:phosphomannomutase/phosphoglucomutase [Hyphomicrobiales bacterium]
MNAERPIPPHIFRAYDIRGIVGQGLDSDSVALIGQAIGTEALALGEHTLLAGADARLSSPRLSAALIEGILRSGCNVCDLGVVPTPLLYFGTHTLPTGSGVMLTGSHNPREYNGIKIVLQQRPLADDRIANIRERIERGELSTGAGQLSHYDIVPDYIARIRGDIQLQRPPRVVLDCGNGVTGKVAPLLYRALGCEVVPLYCELDGNFPNHHPDPTRAEHLQDLISAVRSSHADLGIAFDGDGDRVGLVTAAGGIIDNDHLLLAFVQDLLPAHPGARVVYDVKSSHHLERAIRALGGVPVLCKSGHSFVKHALRESDALLGGEYSAHVFFKHRWFGFDDGMYVGVRFLELMDRRHCAAEQLLQGMPESVSTPELSIPVPEQDKFTLMERVCAGLRLPGASLNLLDGVRADFPHGWGLIRASNTTPALVLRFEADTATALAAIQALFATELRALLPGLPLPL